MRIPFWRRSAVVDPKARRTRRRSLLRFLGVACFWVGIGLTLWIANKNLVKVSAFEVERVEIAGLHHLTQQELMVRIQMDPKDLLPSLDLPDFKERLLSHPWIEEVRIRKVYPNRLIIDVTERLPYLVLQEGSRRVLADRSGVLLGEALTTLSIEEEDRLPTVVGLHLPDTFQSPLDDLSGFRQAVAFLKVAYQEDRPAASPFVVDVGQKDETIVDWNGFHLRVGVEGYEEAWKQFHWVREDIIKRKDRIQEVDLRFPGQVIVR